MRTQCKWCGGPIARVTNVAYVGRSLPVPDDRPWVHLNVEDWRDSVHSAEPQRLPPIGEVL